LQAIKFGECFYLGTIEIMREIAIVGIGQTPIGEHWDQSIREIAGEAVFAAKADAGVDRVDGVFIGNMLSGMVTRQENLGSMVTDWIGQRGTEAYKVEAACGSGAAAFRLAIMAVASGELDSAIVLGVEKMSETKGVDTTAALATAADADFETSQGLSFVAINALVMQRYLHEYGWRHTDFAPFSINSHRNAVSNPYARLQEPITERDYTRARMICTPINLLDASPTGDGAAAVVVVPREHIFHHQSVTPTSRSVITVMASASATDTLAVHSRRDPLWLSAAYQSSKMAYSQAGIDPMDIDFFELHDAFSIMSVLSLEACGFAERGQGPRLGLDGEILLNGRIPICTRGGLKARGHPVGATGVYQIVEVVQQLRGEAGSTQVDGARIGMAQNIGGSGATIITHLLRAEIN
jgi:acetyl-CoA C-acetyltransferase